MPDALTGLIRADPQPSFLQKIFSVLRPVAPHKSGPEPVRITVVNVRQRRLAFLIHPIEALRHGWIPNKQTNHPRRLK